MTHDEPDRERVQSEVRRVLASRPRAVVRSDFAARVAQRLTEQSGWVGLADWRWLSLRLAPIAALILLAAGITVERRAANASAAASSFSTVVERWASDESGSVPVTSVLWQSDTSDDAALLAVLAAPSDATIAGTDR